MGDSEEERGAIEFASKLFQWYRQPTDDMAVLNDICSHFRQPEEAVVANLADYILWLKREMQHCDFEQRRTKLLKRWTPYFAGGELPSSTQAMGMVREWAVNLDHSLMFSHSLMLGQSTAVRDRPLTDQVVSYYANRTAWTLHFITQGSAIYFVDRRVDASEGDILLISPDTSCHYNRHPDAATWVHNWALFEPQPSWKELLDWPACAAGVYRIVPERSCISVFKALFDELLVLRGEQTDASSRLQNNLFEQLLIRCARQLDSKEVIKVDPRVAMVTDIIAEDLSATHSIAQIAKQCNLSESRLSHLFQSSMQTGIAQYRSQLRAQYAKKQLVMTHDSVASVGRKVGYSNPEQFSKFFFRQIGCSPSAFRNIFRHNQSAVIAGKVQSQHPVE